MLCVKVFDGKSGENSIGGNNYNGAIKKGGEFHRSVKVATPK